MLDDGKGISVYSFLRDRAQLGLDFLDKINAKNYAKISYIDPNSFVFEKTTLTVFKEEDVGDFENSASNLDLTQMSELHPGFISTEWQQIQTFSDKISEAETKLETVLSEIMNAKQAKGITLQAFFENNNTARMHVMQAERNLKEAEARLHLYKFYVLFVVGPHGIQLSYNNRRPGDREAWDSDLTVPLRRAYLEVLDRKDEFETEFSNIVKQYKHSRQQEESKNKKGKQRERGEGEREEGQIIS